MLAKPAIRAFLNRDLDEFTWLKKTKHWELNEALKELPVKTRKVFHTKPFHHQKACFLIGANYNEFLFFLEMGTGKTKIALDLIQYHMLVGNSQKALVLVPNAINIDNWTDEAEVHQPNLNVLPMYGGTKERMPLLDVPADVCVINYQGLIRMVSNLEQRKNGKQGQELVIDKKAVEKVFGGFDMVIFDESTLAKNHQSLTFRVCNQLARRVDIRYALTGTPMGRDPQDFWAQFYLVDRGDTLGPTLEVMRSVFFKREKKQFARNKFAYEYHFDPKMEKKFYRTIKNRSITYDADECRDMPRKVYARRRVKLDMEAEKYMEYVLNELKKAGGDWKAINSSYTLMRQICSGFLGMRNDESGDKIEMAFDRNPKLEMLESIVVDEMDPSQKIIIFHKFIYSGREISAMLDKHKIKHERIWSGAKDKVGAIRRFKQEKGPRVLVANYDSADKGLNLQIAKHMLIYESPDDPIARQQMEARIRRGKQKGLKKGKKGRVFYTDLVVRNSIEEKILKNLKEGRNLKDRLTKGTDYEKL